MGYRIDHPTVEGAGGAFHGSEHERDRIALRQLPILGLPDSSQQKVAR